jgi:hypothetical protein
VELCPPFRLGLLGAEQERVQRPPPEKLLKDLFGLRTKVDSLGVPEVRGLVVFGLRRPDPVAGLWGVLRLRDA